MQQDTTTPDKDFTGSAQDPVSPGQTGITGPKKPAAGPAPAKLPEGFIPLPQWKYIANNIPVLCVDNIIVRYDPGSKDYQYLLCLRTNPPLAGCYWTPGGRVYKGESLISASLDNALAETGLPVTHKGIVGIFEAIFDPGKFETPYHCISFVNYLEIDPGRTSQPIMYGGTHVILDNQHNNYTWLPLPNKAKKITKEIAEAIYAHLCNNPHIQRWNFSGGYLAEHTAPRLP